jgi:undecaprenyl diphosphate synthase
LGILKLLEDNIDEGLEFAQSHDTKIHHLGKLDRLPPIIRRKISRAQELTQNNSQLTLGLAFNYGSRDELVDVVRNIVQTGVNPKKIDESVIRKNLYTSAMPDPDLIIRTGGEKRLSNFLLWQAAYAEIYFTSTLWPDFNKRAFDKALIAYSKRERRFGGLSTE